MGVRHDSYSPQCPENGALGNTNSTADSGTVPFATLYLPQGHPQWWVLGMINAPVPIGAAYRAMGQILDFGVFYFGAWRPYCNLSF